MGTEGQAVGEAPAHPPNETFQWCAQHFFALLVLLSSVIVGFFHCTLSWHGVSDPPVALPTRLPRPVLPSLSSPLLPSLSSLLISSFLLCAKGGD